MDHARGGGDGDRADPHRPDGHAAPPPPAQKLARETLSLDRLSAGRLVLGVGMGGDPGGELTAFGEELDPKAQGQMLDEALEVLVDLVR